MSPHAGGPFSDDPAPKATARQILRVMRHRSLSVRKEGIPAQLSLWLWRGDEALEFLDWPRL